MSDQFDDLIEALKSDEGSGPFTDGKFRLYKCPADKWTIGWGHNIQDNGITKTQANQILIDDAIQAMRDAADLVPNWVKLDPVRQNVVSNMSFNMGKATLSGFNKFLAAVNMGDYTTAAKEMQDSKWFVQVGARAKRLQREMLTGRTT